MQERNKRYTLAENQITVIECISWFGVEFYRVTAATITFSNITFSKKPFYLFQVATPWKIQLKFTISVSVSSGIYCVVWWLIKAEDSHVRFRINGNWSNKIKCNIKLWLSEGIKFIKFFQGLTFMSKVYL